MVDTERELRDAIENLNLGALQEAFEKLPDPPADRRNNVDNLFRIRAISILSDSKNVYEDYSKLADFCAEAAMKELSSKSQPGHILVDAFEVTTIDKCEELFGYLESRANKWKEAGLIAASSNQLLRIGNDLLRRLSRSMETEFCGRVLIFLARCLPLTERSGVNMPSVFNVDNITKFDPVDPASISSTASVSASIDEQAAPAQKVVAPAEPMELEEGETVEAGSSQITVDYNLYMKFWQLQSFFSVPLSCYDKFKWRQFQHNANEIFNAFQLLKLESPSMDHGNPAKKAKLTDEDNNNDESSGHIEHRRPTWATELTLTSFSEEQQRSTYFAKYLTSQRLLHLQFSDSTFRRYVLVQCLILFQYLTADVKFKDKKTHVLNDEQTRWVDESIKKCYELLAETYPNGKEFAKVIQRILDREEHWNQWKNTGCEDFTKRPDKQTMNIIKKRPKPRRDEKKFDLGNPTLTHLWNIEPDNFEACRSSNRKFIPELEPFLDEPIGQLDPEAGVEDRLISDENYQWRMLRVIAMRSPHFFSQLLTQKPITSYITDVLEKTSEDMPKYAGMTAKRRSAQAANGEETTNGQDQQEQDIKTDTNAEDEAELRSQNLEGPGEQTITPEQIESLSKLIDADWVKLAQELEIPDESIAALKKKQVPTQACSVLLSQWCELEGSAATVKRLRNILLKAELFNEDVSAVLNNTAGSSSASPTIDTPRPVRGVKSRSITEALPSDKEDVVEEVEMKPARVSSTVSISRKRSSNAVDATRATTPVMDERQSTASN